MEAIVTDNSVKECMENEGKIFYSLREDVQGGGFGGFQVVRLDYIYELHRKKQRARGQVENMSFDLAMKPLIGYPVFCTSTDSGHS